MERCLPLSAVVRLWKTMADARLVVATTSSARNADARFELNGVTNLNREQFPEWAQPYLGKWWRPIMLIDWYVALVQAGLLKEE